MLNISQIKFMAQTLPAVFVDRRSTSTTKGRSFSEGWAQDNEWVRYSRTSRPYDENDSFHDLIE